jgi:hypothetical protein
MTFQQALNTWVGALVKRDSIDLEHVPLVGSVDIRQNPDGRVCPIDPNRYPQGFNNVSAEDFVSDAAAAVPRTTISFDQDAAGLLRKRISPATTSRIHVVEEDYRDPKHPYGLPSRASFLPSFFP